MAITYGDHLIDSGAHDITPVQECEIEASEECDLNDHLPLRYEDTPDYCEVFDKNGEKVALTARPDLFRALERRVKQLEFAQSTREAILAEKIALMSATPTESFDIAGRSVMQRFLDAAGWDAGSLRHKQLEDALDGAQLEIVPNSRLSCGHERIDPSKPCEVCATADQPHARSHLKTPTRVVIPDDLANLRGAIFPHDAVLESADEEVYQPRTIERLIEILRSHGGSPHSWQQEAADALLRMKDE